MTTETPQEYSEGAEELPKIVQEELRKLTQEKDEFLAESRDIFFDELQDPNSAIRKAFDIDAGKKLLQESGDYEGHPAKGGQGDNFYDDYVKFLEDIGVEDIPSKQELIYKAKEDKNDSNDKKLDGTSEGVNIITLKPGKKLEEFSSELDPDSNDPDKKAKTVVLDKESNTLIVVGVGKSDTMGLSRDNAKYRAIQAASEKISSGELTRKQLNNFKVTSSKSSVNENGNYVYYIELFYNNENKNLSKFLKQYETGDDGATKSDKSKYSGEKTDESAETTSEPEYREYEVREGQYLRKIIESLYETYTDAEVLNILEEIVKLNDNLQTKDFPENLTVHDGMKIKLPKVEFQGNEFVPEGLYIDELSSKFLTSRQWEVDVSTNLNIRNAKGELVGNLENGEIIELSGKSRKINGIDYVQLSSQRGWVAYDYLREVGYEPTKIDTGKDNN